MKFEDKFLVSLIICGLFSLIAACETPVVSNPDAANAYDNNVNNEVEVRQDIQFADIPVPNGFFLRRKDSHTFQGSSIRFGNLAYDGTWNAWNTSQWYLTEMPKTGWKLVNSQFNGDYEVTHTFNKGTEKALVHIYHPDRNIRVDVIINDPPATPEKK